MKKIKLRASQFNSDSRIFREVNALSRLNHRFIVRYYTTWVEVADEPGTVPPSTTASSSAGSSERSGTEVVSGSDHSDEGGGGTTTSVPLGESDSDGLDPFRIDFDDGTDTDTGTGTDMEGGESHNSFPSNHFTRSSSTREARDEDGTSSSEGSLFDIVFEEDGAVQTAAPTAGGTEEVVQ